MPLLALRVAPADLIWSTSPVCRLESSHRRQGTLRIGAGLTHASIEDGEVPDPAAGLMRRVASGIAYRAVRNHGTIGGSVALADPAADWPVCLLALGALVQSRDRTGSAASRIDDLLQGAYTTSLRAGEIITAFEIAEAATGFRYGHTKVVRKSGAFANSIACLVQRQPNGTWRAVLGGTTTRARLLPALAARLQASPSPAEADLRSAIAEDLAAVEPDADAYQQRLHTATILRALKEALSK